MKENTRQFIPSVESVRIKVHPNLAVLAQDFITKAGGKTFIKKVTLGVIQAETSFSSRNWIQHGIAGLTTSASKGEKPTDQLPNITGDYVDLAHIISRKRTTDLDFNFVGFPMSMSNPQDCVPASAIASYLVNKTIRRISAEKTELTFNARTELARTIGIYVTGSPAKRPNLHASAIYARTGWRIKSS